MMAEMPPEQSKGSAAQVAFGLMKQILCYFIPTRSTGGFSCISHMYTKFETAETIFHMIFRELDIVEL
jgi:hypothetical protein